MMRKWWRIMRNYQKLIRTRWEKLSSFVCFHFVSRLFEALRGETHGQSCAHFSMCTPEALKT